MHYILRTITFPRPEYKCLTTHRIFRVRGVSSLERLKLNAAIILYVCVQNKGLALFLFKV